MNAEEFLALVPELDPRQFERLVHDALSTAFKEVREGAVLGNDWVDFFAESQNGIVAAIEVKHRRYVDTALIHEVGDIRTAIRQRDPRLRMLLIVSGLLSPAARREALSAQVEVWDGLRLAELVDEEIRGRYFGRAIGGGEGRSNSPTRGCRLTEALAGIPAGEARWADYQRLVTEIVEYLFVPPLADLARESPDAERRNRRDIVLANPATDDFWHRMRVDYAAHYVVVDAKNHDRPLSKKPVLEIAHYLKSYGVGLFALLVSRRGAGPAAQHAIREQWIAGKKMIVSLSDDDMREMLRLRDCGGHPQEVVRKRIDTFRLSL